MSSAIESKYEFVTGKEIAEAIVNAEEVILEEFVQFSESQLHHPFCNFWNRPIKGCSCNKMKEKYGDMTVEEIMKKHFQ